MAKLSFQCDYTTGAHPEILKKLIETNMTPLPGYGLDEYCIRAKEKIKSACNAPDAQIYFLTGGTQTNSIVIAALLRDYQGVVSADTGHIGGHEAGAVEYTGHKIFPISQHLGKIDPKELLQYLTTYFQEEDPDHVVHPGLVYISHPTEWGTLYTKEELTEISQICKQFSLPLFLDGARLGYGLMSNETDVTLNDIASLCDAFYIGGTKVGALCGEAVVFNKEYAPKHFTTIIKQHGALLAKGRLIGIQFDTLFTNQLYFNISRHAIEMAKKLKELLTIKGYSFAWDSPTNQQFVILTQNQIDRLKEQVDFERWSKWDDSRWVVRFATSWSTTEDDLEQLSKLL